MARRCLFCGAKGPGVLSDEHVIPEWLLNYVELPDDDIMFHGVANAATGQLTKSRIHSSFNFLEGRVCIECNTGWMSALEAVAKPILIPLLDNKRPVSNLSVEERLIVWKWTAKTAYVHSWAGPLKNAQLPHLHALYGPAGLPVEGVYVVAMQADFTQPTGYYQAGTWPHFQPPAELVADVIGKASGSYKVGLQFRHLYLLTAFWPNPSVEIVLRQDMHLPVWPMKTAPWTVWSADYISTTDHAIGLLVDFTNTLAAQHSHDGIS